MAAITTTSSTVTTTTRNWTTTGEAAEPIRRKAEERSDFVRRSGDDYAEALATLLPRGAAWPRDPGSVLMQLVSGLGQVWGDIDGRAADLLERETDARVTVELLTEWERAFGLPDATGPILAAPARFRVGTSQLGRDGLMRIEPTLRTRGRAESPPATLEERRQALLAKMTRLGGQSRAFFVATAAALGYPITITEFSPFVVGVSRLGDTRPTKGKAIWFRCGQSQCGQDHHLVLPSDFEIVGPPRWRLGRPESRFTWRVEVTGFRASWFRVAQSRLGLDRLLKITPRPDRFAVGRSRVGIDPLVRVGRADDLEALFRRWKPAHSHIVFNYAQVL